MTTIITYSEIKNQYEKFKKNPPEDEFERWYLQYSFAKNLINFAKKQNLDKDIFEYNKVKDEAAQKLRDMGYNVSGK